MNKILVAVFDSETKAFEGLAALKDLHEKADITLYSSAVIIKDANGAASVKQANDSGPIGSAVGALTGTLLGIIGGPIGMAVGASVGILGGLVYDSLDAGVNIDFLDEVSKVIAPGKCAVIAEIDEDWAAPVDTKLAVLSADIFRRSRSELIEDNLANESLALSKEINDLKKEMKESNAKTKEAVKKTFDSVKDRLQANSAKIDAKIDQVSKETDAKIIALQNQMKKAREGQAAKISNRIAEIKLQRDERTKKLLQAKVLIKEALKP